MSEIDFINDLSKVDPIFLGVLGSLAAGMMTTIGAIPIFFGKIPGEKASDTLLGFAAGVMLSASFFSLIIPSLEYSEAVYGGTMIPAAIAVLGILIGASTLALLNRFLPHEHFFQGPEGPPNPSLRRIWIFIIAISIHNFPEGLAVGVGFGTGNFRQGLPLAIGIGLQNAPEGLAVAVA